MNGAFWAVCLFSGTASIAFRVHLEDCCVMYEPVDGSQCHGRVWEDSVPFSEGLVCGYEHGPLLVSRADEFEQHARFSLILGDVGDVIKDEEVEFIELCNGAFK